MPAHPESDSRRGPVPIPVMVRACQLFEESRLDHLSIEEVASRLSEETGRTYTRAAVNRILARAFRERLFVVRPPPDLRLARELAERFDALESAIHVVSAAPGGAAEAVAAEAARDSLRLIQDLEGRIPSKRPVGVGLVGGGTVQRVAQLMADEMRNTPGLPKVKLHTLSSGFDPENPETDPVSFLGYFADVDCVEGSVALRCLPAVNTDRYEEELLENPISRAAFDRKDDIDLVITSLAAARDDHNVLRDIAKVTETDGEKLVDGKIVADVAYAPYGAEGPLEIEHGYRPVTLLSIEDLVASARDRSKEVMLVAGPCRHCERDPDPGRRAGAFRHDALLPVMTVPTLRVWSQLYLDTTTATGLLRPEQSAG